jgi:hypothetical protein
MSFRGKNVAGYPPQCAIPRARHVSLHHLTKVSRRNMGAVNQGDIQAVMAASPLTRSAYRFHDMV